MDHRTFDDLSRSLASHQSRRGVLRAVAATMAAVVGLGEVKAVSADTYNPVPLKNPKKFKSLRGRSDDRIPCGSKYCTEEQTCNSTGTGCIPRGGVECGSGYCVADEQTCIENRGCLPDGSTACGSGRCEEDDYCVDGQSICVDDCPAEQTCGGVCCTDGHICDQGSGTCVQARECVQDTDCASFTHDGMPARGEGLVCKADGQCGCPDTPGIGCGGIDDGTGMAAFSCCPPDSLCRNCRDADGAPLSICCASQEACASDPRCVSDW